MSKKIVVFANENKKSVEALIVRLLVERDESIELHFISDPDYLKKFYWSIPKIDVLVFGENFFRKAQSGNWSKAKSVFVLTTTLHNEEIEESGALCLMNFDVEGSFERILTFSNIDKEETEVEEDQPKEVNTKVIGICSSGYHVGKTTIALALSTALSKEKKVLYMDAERIQTFIHLIKNKKYIPNGWINKIRKNMDSQTLYRLYQEVIHKEGFDYLAPFENLNIARKITLGFYTDVINVMKGLGIYDYIIVDTESLLGPPSTLVTEVMDKILYITEDTKKFCQISQVYFASGNSIKPERLTFISNETQQRIAEDKTVTDRRMGNAGIPFDHHLNVGDFSNVCEMEAMQTLIDQIQERKL